MPLQTRQMSQIKPSAPAPGDHQRYRNRSDGARGAPRSSVRSPSLDTSLDSPRFDLSKLPEYIHEQDVDELDCSICSLEEHMDEPFSRHSPGAPDFGAQSMIGLVLKCLSERQRDSYDWPDIDRRICKLVREWCRQRDTPRNIQTVTPCRFCYRMHVEGDRYTVVQVDYAVGVHPTSEARTRVAGDE
ncbi:hypothetical protein BDP81DRAFT_170251 [Colletotrichum phormii]|uniref:Uncharacterized protein n=1 Tax=Colletotrichum phormii TaxID=359342 RepID=A0AAJ0E7S2_9PEZI|nr:uncharacterized protein BDP81DRAFT_170251 [Colletotrichum phormii]KAK1621886.1 hypothetical protein BDP81DRAFT_170251 [Colletotrichum phormii]